MNTEESSADLVRRVGARIIDWVLVGAITVVGQVISLVVDGVLGVIIGLACYVGALGFGVWNQVVRVGRSGHSLGKQWLSLQVVDERSGQPVGIGPALAREVVLGLLAAACLLPALVNLVIIVRDPRRQGWHDKVAASLVVPIAPPRLDEAAPSEESAAPSQPVEAPPATYTPAAPPPTPPAGMVGPPPGVAPPPSAPAPEETRAPEQPAGDLPVEETVMGPRADRAPGLTEPPHSAGPEWTLTAPDGSSRVVAGPVLVGREPDPALVGGADVWAIDDPRLTMSKTHALLGIEDGTAWVEDWHSTNGVALHRGEAQLVIEPHARTPLRDGDVIEFGAFKVTVEVRP